MVGIATIGFSVASAHIQRKKIAEPTNSITLANIIHAPYVLEFVEIPQQKRYKETELEKALKINMEQFLLELGRCLYWRTNWCQTFQS